MSNMLLPIAWVLLITFAGYLPFYRNPLYADQSLFCYLGKSWFQGQVPYRDFPLMAGPHMMAIYGFLALLSRDNERVVNILTVLYVSLGNLFLFLAVDSAFGHVAAVFASAFYACYIFSPRLLGDRFPPETYMTTPVILSLYLLPLLAPSRRCWGLKILKTPFTPSKRPWRAIVFIFPTGNRIDLHCTR
jgi:drug/metabolite transporter (DMT)-like permease